MTDAPPASRTAMQDVSWQRIAVWTMLFQLAWFWRKIPLLLNQGQMPDTDDFQRLAQMRSWMAGQGWYDIFNHAMDPPNGADMHWSRLIDLPLALLTAAFDLFADTVTAERLAAMAWPTLLLFATVMVVLAICRRLDNSANPLLALLFTVTCITALTEFAPGRIDHHGVQILLFCLMLLGLVSTRNWWGNFLIGASIACSISVGLDAILIIGFVLAWVAMEWASGRDSDGSGLRRTAIGIFASAPLLYVLNFPPKIWLAAQCDANSVFYFTALMLAATAFSVIAATSVRFPAANAGRTGMVARFGVATLAGMIALAVLLWLYPHCAAGPFSQLPQELKTRWLVNILEARGLFDLVETLPQMWISNVAWVLVLLLAGGWVLARHGARKPELLALYATFLISVAASLVQYRAMRIGVFAAIPFCVLFVSMVSARIAGMSAVPAATKTVLHAAIIAMLASPAWLGIAHVLVPQRGAADSRATTTGKAAQLSAWRLQAPDAFCNRQSDYAVLGALKPGLIMSDSNSGPEIVVFTSHFAVGGPYHRNARAIIDMLDFFGTDLEKPLRIARDRSIAYVAFCEPVELRQGFGDETLANAIVLGHEPGWLERLSPVGARLHVFRFRQR